MKDRVREALFNLLGPVPPAAHAIDLFAGTGALGLEAISRGAARATLIERHFPTARVLEQNIETLQVAAQCSCYTGDAFHWVRHELPAVATAGDPLLVFCSPPYAFYRERSADMQALICQVCGVAPPRSSLVVEASVDFKPSCLPHSAAWLTRAYPPALICLARLPLPDSLEIDARE